jgi:hypothetical protein
MGDLTMKREIEFRGRTGKGEWVYGCLLNDKHNKIGFYNSCYEFEINGVIPETVGQYVGVEDINKKKIYEYDRVKCKGVKPFGTVLFDGGGVEVKFDEPIAEDWTSTALYCLINEEGFAECEVIGTVFDKEGDNDC